MILLIVFLGIAVGGGAYLLSKKSTNIKSGVPGGKITEQLIPETNPNLRISPAGQTNPTTSQAQGNFTQKGNLSLQENGNMFLVWDVPGNPAVNVQLKFTDQSICLIGGKNDCSLLKKFADGLAYCRVEGNRISDKVTVSKLEEIPLPQ